MEEITFDKEARELLLSGINKATKAVAATMGPNGKTVIIPDSSSYNKYKITKDGVSVINSIKLKNPIENIGVELLRYAAQKTVEQAGDGTTTATVLAAAFINDLKDFNTVEINKAFDEIIPKVIEQLKVNSKTLNKDDIKYVASISANNDTVIGDLIQEAYNHSNLVKIEESDLIEDNLELVDGIQLKVSYLSKDFINNQKKGECNLTEPNVIIIDGKIENLKAFENVIKSIASKNESLLIVAEDVHENTMRILRTVVINKELEVCVIKSPGFSQHRKDLLKDLCKFTGASLITDMNTKYSLDILGKLKSCKIDKNSSLLVKDSNVDVTEEIDILTELLKSKDLTKYDKDLIEQRLENFIAKVSIIKVGGSSELNMKERFDRYDDAVKAVACALEEGIVEGGGFALLYSTILDKDYIQDSGAIKYILKSLSSPLNTIIKNGADFSDQRLTMFEQNIIDPLKVTRCALENAVSVAKIILSTEAVVLDQTQWNMN